MSENLTVGIVMGSASDTEIMKLAKDVLDEFGLANEMRILSAHRTPNEVVSWVKSCEQRGAKNHYCCCWDGSTSSWCGFSAC